MTFLLFTFSIIAVLFVGRFLVRMNTLRLHNAYYRKANERGCAERYESLVRFYARSFNSTDARVLEMAFLEAVASTKTA